MADDNKDDKPKEDAVRAALVTASESDDEEKASKAKRALAAYDAEQDDKDDKPAKKDEPDGDESKALAQAVAPLAKQVAAQQAELAALKAEADASKRASLFAARPDIKPELIKSLDATPTSALKAVLDAIPVTAGFQNPHVTVPMNRPTIGANGGRPGLSANAELNEQMGLTSKTTGVIYEANSQVFGGSK